MLATGLSGIFANGMFANVDERAKLPIRSPTRPYAIAKLPKHVNAPDGKLSLYADFTDVRRYGRVPLYLVNRTKKTIVLPAEGDHVYIKLEARTKDGRWRRAQRHTYSFCGNSYYKASIKPDTFLVLAGWRSQKGEQQTVRYRLYGRDVISNTGRGLVDSAEIEKAAKDRMSVAYGSIDLVKRVLFKESKPFVFYRGTAVIRLGDLPRKQSLPVLERVLTSEGLLKEVYYEAIFSLVKVAPDRLQHFARKFLVAGTWQQREFLLQNPDFFNKGGDDEVRALLMKQLRDPKTRDFRLVMSFLVARRQPGIERHLASIQNDEKYPRHLRIAARYEREKSFGDKKLGINVESVGEYRREPPPLPLVVTLTNTSKQTIAFSYRAPSDILSLYLEIGERFLPPRRGVVWFGGTTRGKSKTVTLKPGQTHQLRVNVLDYFDLPRGTDYCHVYLSCSIPRVHTTPQLATTAASFSQPLRYMQGN